MLNRRKNAADEFVPDLAGDPGGHGAGCEGWDLAGGGEWWEVDDWPVLE
jgi:hypothetical protein